MSDDMDLMLKQEMLLKPSGARAAHFLGRLQGQQNSMQSPWGAPQPGSLLAGSGPVGLAPGTAAENFLGGFRGIA